MFTTQQLNTKDYFLNAQRSLTISKERKAYLEKIAHKISEIYLDKKQVNINFICTHNSRRSQLAQVWAFYATSYFKLKNMFCYSGGTQVTAFYRNTVYTLKSVGFTFNVIHFSHQNPKYLISFKNAKKSILGYSKLYNSVENNAPFIAITTCNSADENCPFIPEALARFHLPFIDPKFSDETDKQQETYLKTNQQIAGEIFIIFNKVKEILS